MTKDSFTVNPGSEEESTDVEKYTDDDFLYKLVDDKKWKVLKDHLNDKNVSQKALNFVTVGDKWQGMTVLQNAVLCGAPHSIIEKLVELGGKEKVLQKSDDGWIPIHWVRKSTAIETVKLLVEVGGVDTIRTEDEWGLLPLHWGTDRDLDIEGIKYLVENGGVETVLARDNDGRLPIHSACDNDFASVEVIKYLVEVGGEGTVLQPMKNGELPIHRACKKKKPLEVIQFLYELGGDQTLVSKNNQGAIPLDLLYKEGHTDSILHTHHRWLQIDPHADNIPFSTADATLKWLMDLDVSTKSKVIHSGKCIKILCNREYIRPRYLMLTMFDLFVRIASVVVFSFVIGVDLSNISGPRHDLAMLLLVISIAWMLFRESVQVSTTPLKAYVTDPSNLVDLAQIILMILCTQFLMGDTTNPTNNDIMMFIWTIATTWLGVLFGLGNVLFALSVFVAALVEIVHRLMPFIFTTGLIIVMFSHIFRMYFFDPNNECTTDADWVSTDGWTSCAITDSYLKSLSLFLSSEWDFEEKSGVSIMFALAIIVGILLLNIVIAVVSNVFTEVTENAERAFWENRISWIAEMNLMLALFKCVCIPGEKNIDTRKSMSKSIIAVAASQEEEQAYLTERIPFSVYPGIEAAKSIPANFGWWWFEEFPHLKPSFVKRFIVFYKYSELGEILFPSKVFELVFIGLPYNADTGTEEYSYSREGPHGKVTVSIAIYKLFLAKICAWVVFCVHIVLFILIFVAGLVTCGYLWPIAMKEMLFQGPLIENNEEKAVTREMTKTIISEFQKQMKELKDEQKRDIDVLKAEIMKLQNRK